MNIEAIIYAVGACTILLCLFTLLLFCIYLISTHLLKAVTVELRRLYYHQQLRYFMGILVKKGYASLAEESEKIGYKVIDNQMGADNENN